MANINAPEKISENFRPLDPLIYVRLHALIISILLLAFANGQTPPVSSAKKEYLERRATILRQMAEVKAKLSALELDLQLLEESRLADPPAPPLTSWREEAPAPDGSVRKSTVRCLSFTRDGKRCTRPAEAGGKYCWQHRLH